MKILMIANFVGFPWEGANSRFTYILDKLNYEENQAELITSNFKHGAKDYRNESELKKTSYKITLIDHPRYKKNVSFKRIIGHKKFAKNIQKYLNNLSYKPDVIYCAVPPLSVSKSALKYAKKNNIRFIVDIQDLWPESFKMVVNIPFISDILFYPMLKSANYIYKNSDCIIAVSNTFVNRAIKVNKDVTSGLSVFLGTDLKYFDQCRKNNIVKFNDDVIRIAYIGTLGTSYDIKSVIDAIAILNKKGISNVKFVVMGTGPLKDDFELYAKEKNIDFEFTGRLVYSEMIGLLCSCDICVNPIIGTSVSSIINKVGDYAASGLPVINTQNSNEYRDLVDEYKAGFNCINGDVNDIAEKMEILIKDKKLRLECGRGNRKLAEDKFDRDKTYREIVKEILNGDSLCI